MLLVVIVLLLVLGLGAAPVWPHAADWGYGPSGVVGLLLIILVILALTGRL